ncbi:hypothetical protein SCLCIDRAFT_106220 [Scleroderma citrinum Foug A]|uniref:DUF7330 domain-containing protein n=1 Tax=Scleroderma citrinum Foug A TaxID=1036808 RepID=A0A0C3E5U5_9AGAM|nr:hypothetical protein SCLCIDRAFT_106220 [Scleroderma citrinum Foug A]
MYVQGQFDTEDYPPAYDIHTQDTHPPASASASIPAAVGDPLTKLNQKPTNFLYVDETHHSIKGTYVIDPSLHIPEAYLHPLNPEEERKNLYLHSRDGSVDVDLWIVGRKSDSYQEKQRHDPRRTKIHVSSRSGTVSVKVNAIDNIHPLSLEVLSRDGRISVFIPRSFHGHLVLKSVHGNCVLSDELLRNSTQLGTVDSTKRIFVGDFSAISASASGSGSESSSTPAEWAGDELRAETRDGRVRVKYVDEVESVVSKRGFFGRLFFD